MRNEYSKSILASYATFKELYKSKKYTSPYQILSEFIQYIIISKSLYCFSSTDLQGYLKDDFGFHPPIAVIRTALKGIKGLKCEYQKYSIDPKTHINNSDFKHAQSKSEEYKQKLINSLIDYARLKEITVDNDKIERELYSFVLDEGGEKEYQQLIGEFILHNKDNTGITKVISTIQEGGILYAGLTNNISELGSLKKPITLFLDTEILFDIVGLNGTLYKALADDFLRLVKSSNNGTRLISLRFFPEVADDINRYFSNAERVVEGKGEIVLDHAMKSIVQGCEDVTNVVEKKTDFFRRLDSEHGIKKYEKRDFYDSANLEYNLEQREIPGFSADDSSNFEAMRFCSHINVLRKGEKTSDLFLSKYLCITGTKRVLDISRVLIDLDYNSSNGERPCGFAASLNYITNLLWYKLNRGFGSVDFPHNLDAVIKARILLSGYISQEITTTYSELKQRAISGELNQEQAASYIVALKEKAILPEALNSDNIEDTLDFSEEYFSRFAETISQNARLIKERDDTISGLSANVKKLEEQLSQANNANEQKQQQIDSLAEKIRAIEQKDLEAKKRKAVFKSKVLLAWAIIWKLLIVIAVVVFTKVVCKIAKVDFGTWLSIVIGVAGLIGIIIQIVKRDIKNHKERCYHNSSENEEL